jgi:hypothetical protein
MSKIIAKTEQELLALLEGIKNGSIVPGNMPEIPNRNVLLDQNAYPPQARYYDAPKVPPAPEPSMGRKTRNSVRGGLGKVETALGLTEIGRSQTKAIADGVRSGTRLMGGSVSAAGRNGRLAMSALRHPALAAGLKWAGPVGGALAVGDLVLGEESLANKGMDAAFMTAGGFLGSAVPVVGTGVGIAAGKMVSDGTQYIFGGGKSAEERELEQALQLLQQRGLI